MTLRKHTRHFSKAKWRVICTHFELSTCMSTLYTADVNIHTTWRCCVLSRERAVLSREQRHMCVKKKRKRLGLGKEKWEKINKKT